MGGRDKPSLLARVTLGVQAVRPWFVWSSVAVVVLVWYFGAFLGSLRDVLLPAATGLLIAFAVDSLVRIERSTQAAAGGADFDGVEKAVPTIADLVRRDRRVTDLKVIAASGRTTVDVVLNAVSKASPAPLIRLCLLVVDADGPFAAAYPAHWAMEVERTHRVLRDNYDNRRFEIEVHKYGYLPTIHGVLVNDRALLFGHFGWDPDKVPRELAGAQRPHHLYARNDPNADQVFEIFDEWFGSSPQVTTLSLPSAG